MRISKLNLSGVPAHKNTTVEFPDTGVVVITGPNGCGKSSIIEGVAWGLYGKTLRGVLPSDCAVSVDVCSNDVSYTAKRSKGKKTRLVFERRQFDYPQTTDDITGDTTSKTQERINNDLLPMSRWKRTCVFSSADAAHFSVATDSERKRLLEEVMGLDVFDSAWTSATKDRREAESAYRDLQSRETDLRHAIQLSEQRIVDAQRSLATVAVHAPSGADLQDALQKATPLKAELDHSRDDDKAHTEKMAVAESNLYQLHKRMGKIEVRCPTCSRDYDNLEERERAREDLRAQLAQAEAKVQSLRQYKSCTSRIQAEYRTLQDRIARLTQAIEASKAQAASVAEWRKIVSEETENLDICTKASRVVQADKEKKDKELKELAICVKALSTSGARGIYFASVLEDIADATNSYLSRLTSEKVEIQISTQIEKKMGGFSDKLDISIDGPGWGSSYNALSGGQRRRVDVALLLALADISATMSGVRGSTLFCDEVFDALDSEGVESVAALLESIAEDRCVVVITHNQELVNTVRSAKTINLG